VQCAGVKQVKNTSRPKPWKCRDANHYDFPVILRVWGSSNGTTYGCTKYYGFQSSQWSYFLNSTFGHFGVICDKTSPHHRKFIRSPPLLPVVIYSVMGENEARDFPGKTFASQIFYLTKFVVQKHFIYAFLEWVV